MLSGNTFCKSAADLSVIATEFFKKPRQPLHGFRSPVREPVKRVLVAENRAETFIDVSEVLNDCPDDLVFKEEETAEAIWEHEKRFFRDQKRNEPFQEVRGALDPAQADILSAYSTEQGFREITTADLAREMEGTVQVTILDVRPLEEYSQGHIAGSQNVSLDRISDAVRGGELQQPDGPLYVICASGSRSAQACVRLAKVLAFKDVVNVKGGMRNWLGEGLPIN